MDFGHWNLPSNHPRDIPVGSIGFVYIITNKLSNKKYIGKKILENKKRRKPLKGRKNSRLYKTESNWKNYTGSSVKLNDDIKLYGKENFQFDILNFYPSKLLLAYNETKIIIENNAIFSGDYYNEICNIRIKNKKN